MYGDDNNEMVVSVDRITLIKVLKDNLAKHKIEYAETLALYYTQVEKDLAALMVEVGLRKTKKKIQFNPSQPKSYEQTYSATIEMLEMSVDPTIKLDGSNFRKFVKDQWEWKREFTTVSNFYKNSPNLDDE